MKKIFALLLSVAMVASLFVGVAFAADVDYVVAFDGSNLAGANSVLQFTVTKNAVTTIAIDFGTTGFVPIGAATMGGVTQATNIVGNVATVTVAATNNPVVKIPVRNPAVAKNILAGAGFGVAISGGDTGVTVSNLSVKYTVTPSITTPVLGGTSTVSFNVTQSGNAVTDTVVYAIYKGAVHVDNLVTSGSTSTGTFSAAISFAAAAGTFSQVYNVVVEKAADTTVNGSAAITSLYNLAVDGVSTVKYLDARTLTGKLTNAAGTGIAGAVITLVNKSAASTVASATTAADGSFAMTAVFADAAVYSFNVGAVEYSTVNVAGLDVTVTATPVSVVKTLGTTDMTFTVKYGTTTAAGAEIRILNPDGTVRQDWTTTLTWTAPANLATGSYKVEARWEDTANGNTVVVYDRTGSTTFTVNNPSKLNVTYLPTVHVENVLTVGANGVAITIRDIAGDGYVGAAATAGQIKKVVLTITGPLTQSVTIDTSVTAPAGPLWTDSNKTINPTFNIEQAGDVVITGTVTFGDNSTETFTKTYANNGWKVTTEKVLGTVGDVVILRATVTTASGTPVNNAIVTWAGVANAFLTAKDVDGVWITPSNTVTVNGSTTNINNGVYEKEVKLNVNGAATVVATTTAPAARASLAASINGQNVYTVTPNVSSVIATLASQTIRVAITNAGLKMTSLQSLDITGSTSVLAAPLSIANATMYDADADGIVDGYEFSVSPLATGTLTITAKTDGGNKVGVATVNVVAPGVTVTPGAKVTQNVTEKLNIRVNDMTGTPAAARTIYLRITAVGANMELKTDVTTPVVLTDGTVENQTHSGFAVSAEHKLLVTAWDFVEAVTAVAPAIKVEVSYNNTNWVKVADLAVTPLNIALNSESLFVGGVNKIEATITDAQGVAYANKAVTLAGSTGTTDANGKVSLFVNPSSTGSATLSVATSRTSVFTTKTMNIVSDTIKPVLTMTSSSSVGSAAYNLTGTFSDNLGVTTIYVNGAPIPFITALGEFELAVTLKTGANVFSVFAFDAAGNGAKETFTVTLAAPVVITLGKANPSIGLDQPAVAKNGRTMLPFRWFGEQILGAAVDYKVVGSAEIVTLVKDGKTVELTLNSTTAKVNGVSVTLDVAAYATNGRTLVPARFLAETFGYTITWDAATNNVTISK